MEFKTFYFFHVRSDIENNKDVNLQNLAYSNPHLQRQMLFYGSSVCVCVYKAKFIQKLTYLQGLNSGIKNFHWIIVKSIIWYLMVGDELKKFQDIQDTQFSIIVRHQLIYLLIMHLE